MILMALLGHLLLHEGLHLHLPMMTSLLLLPLLILLMVHLGAEEEVEMCVAATEVEVEGVKVHPEEIKQGVQPGVQIMVEE